MYIDTCTNSLEKKNLFIFLVLEKLVLQPLLIIALHCAGHLCSVFIDVNSFHSFAGGLSRISHVATGKTKAGRALILRRFKVGRRAPEAEFLPPLTTFQPSRTTSPGPGRALRWSPEVSWAPPAGGFPPKRAWRPRTPGQDLPQAAPSSPGETGPSTKQTPRRAQLHPRPGRWKLETRREPEPQVSLRPARRGAGGLLARFLSTASNGDTVRNDTSDNFRFGFGMLATSRGVSCGTGLWRPFARRSRGVGPGPRASPLTCAAVGG